MAFYAEHHALLVHAVGKLILHAQIRRELPIAVGLGPDELEAFKDYPTFRNSPPLRRVFMGLPVVPSPSGIDLITEPI